MNSDQSDTGTVHDLVCPECGLVMDLDAKKDEVEYLQKTLSNTACARCGYAGQLMILKQ